MMLLNVSVDKLTAMGKTKTLSGYSRALDLCGKIRQSTPKSSVSSTVLIGHTGVFEKRLLTMSGTVCRLERAARAARFLPTSSQRTQFLRTSPSRKNQAYATSTEHLPRVAQPSIWNSIIPKEFREPRDKHAPAKIQQKKLWNPATFFIWIFLLIGSNAIQMLTLRHEHASFNRKADQKIALLKEVLEKVQRGEDVDVEKVLGSGDEEQEQEWSDGTLPANTFKVSDNSSRNSIVIQNIEEEDHLWAAKDRRREKRRLKKEQKAAAQESNGTADQTNDDGGENVKMTAVADQAKKPPTFY